MLPLFTLVLLGVGWMQTQWEWQNFPVSGFKVQCPLILEDRVKVVSTDVAQMIYHQYKAGSMKEGDPAMTFIIDQYEVGAMAEPMDEASTLSFFENTINPILESVNGSLLYMDISQQSSAQVCSWKAEYQEGKCIIRGEAYLTPIEYYGLQVFGWKKDKPEDLMNDFLRSFSYYQPEKY